VPLVLLCTAIPPVKNATYKVRSTLPLGALKPFGAILLQSASRHPSVLMPSPASHYCPIVPAMTFRRSLSTQTASLLHCLPSLTTSSPQHRPQPTQPEAQVRLKRPYLDFTTASLLLHPLAPPCLGPPCAQLTAAHCAAIGGNALSFQCYSGEVVTILVSKNAVRAHYPTPPLWPRPTNFYSASVLD
jgi:putative hemolysin